MKPSALLAEASAMPEYSTICAQKAFTVHLHVVFCLHHHWHGLMWCMTQQFAVVREHPFGNK